MHHAFPFKSAYAPDHAQSWVIARNACTSHEMPILEPDRELPLRVEKSQEYDLLCKTLNYLENIDSFEISFPGATMPLERQADCYDTQALDKTFGIIQLALKSDAFQNLVDLRVQIPCTQHTQHLADAMTNEARRRLKHLSIEIMDITGKDTDSSFTPDTRNSNDLGVPYVGSIHDENIPPSNLQVDFPNKEYQGAMWDFVGSCSNLESLSIKCTHHLDLDRLDWQKSSTSKGLKALYLDRVYTSITSITKLLNPASPAKTLAALQCIKMKDMKLHATGGNWTDLFNFLQSNCPDLLAMLADQLTYHETHEYFMPITRPGEDFSAVWSKNTDDWDQLQSLTRHLIDKVGGIDHYPEPCYEFILDEEEEFHL